MQTRQELILEFMKAISAGPSASELFDRHESLLAAAEIYRRASALADQYIELQ